MYPSKNPQRVRCLNLRSVAVLVHRSVGLTIATFLMVAGLTGSVLVFYQELDAWTNPWHRVVPETPDTPLLDPFELRQRVIDALPTMHGEVSFAPKPGEALGMWEEFEPGQWREHFVNPYTGALLGSRSWGDISEGMINLFPFIYRLHYQLGLGDVGAVLFGIVALLWTIDCFIGLYLTFPARRATSQGEDRRSWLARWKPSWLVKGSSWFAWIFTFHRASGLWIWPLLLIFAWSAVGFNLPSVFNPTMGTFGAVDARDSLPVLPEPRSTPALDWRAAHVAARQIMANEAEKRGFQIHAEDHMGYEVENGCYHYVVRSSLDVTTRWAGTVAYVDGDHGTLVAFDAPTGLAAGSTIRSWLFALHMGSVGGMAYRLLVCLCGLLVVMLCVTGVAIWWRKRSIRNQARQQHETTACDSSAA